MQNNYFPKKNQIKDALGSDIKFIRRYFRCFSYIGIFPFCMKVTSPRIKLLSKWLLFLLLTLFLIGVVSIYPQKIKTVYNHLNVPQLVLDVIEHFAEHFSILAILNGAWKDGQSWEFNFEDLKQVDNILNSKNSYILFHSFFHTLKTVAYLITSFTISAVSIYYWWGSNLLFSHTFHRILLFFITIISVFFISLMNSIRKRYICLNIELTGTLFKNKNLVAERMVENEIEDIKFLYNILDDVICRLNTTFGPQIFFIISFLLLFLLNTFNWIMFDFYRNAAELELVVQIIDIFLDPITYAVSRIRKICYYVITFPNIFLLVYDNYLCFLHIDQHYFYLISN